MPAAITRPKNSLALGLSFLRRVPRAMCLRLNPSFRGSGKIHYVLLSVKAKWPLDNYLRNIGKTFVTVTKQAQGEKSGRPRGSSGCSGHA
jgi:hypothetical protein